MPDPAYPRWRRRTSLALFAAMTLNVAGAAHAQGPRVGAPDSTATATRSPLMQPSAVWAPAAPSSAFPADTATTIPQTHWVTGAAIGGAALGLFTALMVASFCSYEDTTDNCTAETVGGFLLGGVLGAGIGAFIGARFPKHPKPVEEAGTN